MASPDLSAVPSLVLLSLVLLSLVVLSLQVPAWRVEWPVSPRVSELAYSQLAYSQLDCSQPACVDPGLVLPLPDDLRVSKVPFDARALRERVWPRALVV